MAKDIVPSLMMKIRNDFNRDMKSSPAIQNLIKAINSGTATHVQSQQYATEVGRILANVFKRTVTADALPDGRMYYNIAERILNSTLYRNHNLVAGAAAYVQETLNKKAGIGLKALRPAFNKSRVAGLVERLSTEEDFANVAWLLDDPIVNFSQAIVDETVRINAEFHNDAGLSPTITRTIVSETCNWCESLVGTYSYEEVKETGHPVFRRHRNCDCLVVYDPGSGRRQNVHTKKWV